MNFVEITIEIENKKNNWGKTNEFHVMNEFECEPGTSVLKCARFA